jgi:glucosamine--fructose-6-phosphate aminotransferase (isomerizing)
VTADRPRRMLDDILGWPAALSALLDAYAPADGPLSVLDGLVAQRILITGLGSSRFAAMTIEAHLRASSMTAWVEVASPDAPTRPSHEMLTFAVSASGRTAEVVNAVDRHRHTGAVVGVTNQPGSPVAEGADAVLPLLAGEETSGVSCRSYGATLAVLGLAAARLGAHGPSVDELRETVPALRKLHRGRGSWLTAASDLLDRAPSIDVVSGSRRPGSARQAALMLREGPRLPATAQDAPDWSHTAIYTALPGHRAVVFDGTPHDADVVRLVAGRGGASIVVGDAVDGAALSIPVPLSADAHPIARAIVETAVVDLLAAELWRRADASG